MHIW